MTTFSIGTCWSYNPSPANLARVRIYLFHPLSDLSVTYYSRDNRLAPPCRDLLAGRSWSPSAVRQFLQSKTQYLKAMLAAVLPISIDPEEAVVSVTGIRGECRFVAESSYDADRNSLLKIS